MRKDQSQVIGLLLKSDVEEEGPVLVKFDTELWPAIREYIWTLDGGSGDVIGRRINHEGKMERVQMDDLIYMPDGWCIDFSSEDVYDFSKSNLILRPC